MFTPQKCLAGRNELAIVVGRLLAFAINAVIATVWGDHDGGGATCSAGDEGSLL